MKKPFIVSLVLGLLMVSSSVLTMVLTPSIDIADQQNQIDLEALIPSEFNDWKMDVSEAPLLINPDEKGTINKLYTQTLSRTYINRQGEHVMLSIAYGR